ncbi:sigma-54-dependent transcriptional regulator [Propionivibrio sp.]|uniref:sigma-54-dependent transcriptional regulator n=1 Tax=Propionivibrio sp. TaxID=2212460 RepID=UPI0039E2B8BF
MTDAASTVPGWKPLLLIVDDDPLITDTLVYSLSPAFEIVTSHSRPHCIELLRGLRRPPELALVDLGLPPFPHRPDEGFALIADLLGLSPSIKIVVLSGQGDAGNARHARALGAADFVAKPCSPGDLRAILRQALSYRALEKQQDTPLTTPLIGASPAIEKLKLQLQQYADSPFPVLIEGESGTGKEIVAGSYLHHHTQRGGKPFFALNCAAISPTLVEPTLFGYAKGAFTGATAAKSGYFEDAADGTLFLDEIGELPLELQAKLLRVLENGAFHRVGETQERLSRARIVAATNRDLRKEVKAGRFRADLYYRLSVCTVSVPPLREMGDDRLLLLDHFRHLYAAQAQRPAFEFSTEARECWSRYGFPGNVRELRNIVIRLTAKHPGRTVGRAELEAELDIQEEPAPAVPEVPPAAASRPDDLLEAAIARLRQPPFSLDRLLAETEQNYIEAALRLANGNVSQAARLLGINRTTLYNRMESSAREP